MTFTLVLSHFGAPFNPIIITKWSTSWKVLLSRVPTQISDKNSGLIQDIKMSALIFVLYRASTYESDSKTKQYCETKNATSMQYFFKNHHR